MINQLETDQLISMPANQHFFFQSFQTPQVTHSNPNSTTIFSQKKKKENK
jgi:hypothetical protein